MFAWFKGKSFEEQVNEFETKLNLIATSLVKSSEENIEEGNYDLAQLQDLNVCNEYVIFLGNELEKRFKKVDVEDIADSIYIGKRQKKERKNNKFNRRNPLSHFKQNRVKFLKRINYEKNNYI